MSYDTFPASPIPDGVNSNKTTKVNVNRSSFGDGYSQRALDGLNPITESWTLQWSNITTADKQIIDSFLKGKGGTIPFLWVSPEETDGGNSPRLWTCATWGRTPLEGGKFQNFSATFVQEFDPDSV